MWRWISIALIVILIVILIGGYIIAQTMIDELQGEKFRLQSSYNRLEDENEDLRRLLDQYEKVPHNYYSSGTPLYANTYSNLCHFLESEVVLPRGYELGTFDCSEASAYLEWALENAGFDAYIVVGLTPLDPSSGKYHAWVIAYTEDHKLALDAMAFVGGTGGWWYRGIPRFSSGVSGVILRNDPGWENFYNGYDYSYENIYECIRSYKGVEEWNWWEGYWGFE